MAYTASAVRFQRGRGLTCLKALGMLIKFLSLNLPLPQGQLQAWRLPCQASWRPALVLTINTSDIHALLASSSNKQKCINKLPHAKCFLCFEDTAIT